MQRMTILKNSKQRIFNRQIVDMVYNSGNPAQQVFIHAPLNAHVLRHFQYLFDGRFILLMNIISPLTVVGIDLISQWRKKIKIEVIV